MQKWNPTQKSIPESGPRKSRYQKNLALADSNRHFLIMYFSRLFREEGTLTLAEVEKLFKQDSLNISLKRVTNTEIFSISLQVFFMQHPSIFTIDKGVMPLRVHLTPMSVELDELLESTWHERTIDYISLRMREYGKVNVLLNSLFGKMLYSSPDIRTKIARSTDLLDFLNKNNNLFVLSKDLEYVTFRSLYEQSISTHKPLQDSDRIRVDQWLMDITVYIKTVGIAKHISQLLFREKVIAMDMEGVFFGSAHGCITLIQIAVPDGKVYLFDVKENIQLMYALRPVLQSSKTLKVLHGSGGDICALNHQFGFQMNNVFDTLVACNYLQVGAKRNLYALYEYFTGEETNNLKKKIRKMYMRMPDIWNRRPLKEPLRFYAAFDAYSLLQTYFAICARLSNDVLEQVRMISSKKAAIDN